MGIYRYKVEEYFKGKKIEISVNEYWCRGGLKSATVFCSGDSIVRSLGPKMGNPRPCLYGGVLLDIIEPLTTSDVDEVILNKLENSEKNIYGDDFLGFEKRFLNVTINYYDKKMIFGLYVDFMDKSVYIFDEHNNLLTCSTLENSEYRRAISLKFFEFNYFKTNDDIFEGKGFVKYIKTCIKYK